MASNWLYSLYTYIKTLKHFLCFDKVDNILSVAFAVCQFKINLITFDCDVLVEPSSSLSLCHTDLGNLTPVCPVVWNWSIFLSGHRNGSLWRRGGEFNNVPLFSVVDWTKGRFSLWGSCGTVLAGKWNNSNFISNKLIWVKFPS